MFKYCLIVVVALLLMGFVFSTPLMIDHVIDAGFGILETAAHRGPGGGCGRNRTTTAAPATTAATG